MATEAEHEAYATAMAIAEAMIKALGGDPKHPTPQQAETVADLLMRSIPPSVLSHVTAQQVMDWHAEFMRERQ